MSKYVPNLREKLDHAEASTPLTFRHYTKHPQGALFGTKFEGLAVSRGIPQQISGLFHAGSVGIIMSGWLGAMNYGVIVANDVDSLLLKTQSRRPAAKLPHRRRDMSLAEIQAAIPHRAPFLAARRDRRAPPERIVCRKRFTGEEFFYAGHYPDYPLTPGVLFCEAAMQAGAVLLARLTFRPGRPQCRLPRG